MEGRLYRGAFDSSGRAETAQPENSKSEGNAVKYKVVTNAEAQYSIWLADEPMPAGWRPEGFEGDRADCLAHVEAVWTDMRPKSLRERMDEASRPLWASSAVAR